MEPKRVILWGQAKNTKNQIDIGAGITWLSQMNIQYVHDLFFLLSHGPLPLNNNTNIHTKLLYYTESVYSSGHLSEGFLFLGVRLY
jgi:hypothetical protein